MNNPLAKSDGRDEDFECHCGHIHESSVESSMESMPDENLLLDVSDFFKILGDSTRLKILLSLYSGELCVCDICEVVGMNMSAVSHQLRILKDASLVKSRKEGRTVFYSFCDDHVSTIIGTAISHVSEE